MTDELLSQLAARRQISLRRLVPPGPDESSLQCIFEAAAQAPDHGLLRPWRFVLIPPGKRRELADVFVNALMQRNPDCDGAARAAAYEKAFHAPCLLVAILRSDPDASAIPVAEKLISLGCAIQNMLVAAQVLNFASGLASGSAVDSPGMRRFMRLESHEQAICFIGFGTAASSRPVRQRPQPIDFVSSV
jgi:nitroreductase